MRCHIRPENLWYLRPFCLASTRNKKTEALTVKVKTIVNTYSVVPNVFAFSSTRPDGIRYLPATKENRKTQKQRLNYRNGLFSFCVWFCEAKMRFLPVADDLDFLPFTWAACVTDFGSILFSNERFLRCQKMELCCALRNVILIRPLHSCHTGRCRY